MLTVAILLACVIASAVAVHRWEASIAMFVRRYPVWALWSCAAIAAVAASYPVVFCGKSFVSPNTHALLHAAPPTVPGYADTTVHDLHVGDPAVILWQDVAYSIVEHDALLREHALPLWNRYLSAGTTLLGQGQSMLGDPVQLLVIAADGASWAWDVKFVLAKAFFAAGLAIAVWRLTRDVGAALTLAAVAPFVGFFNYRFNHPAVFSVAYSPWILAAWMLLRHARASGGVRGALLLLALSNLAVLGSGTVKEAYALLLALNIAGAAVCLLVGGTTAPDAAESYATPRGEVTPPTSDPRNRCVLGLAALACTAAITAPLWWPFFEALRVSSTSYDAPHAVQLPGWQLIGLVDNLWTLEISPEHRIGFPAINVILWLGIAYACASLRRGAAPRAAILVPGVGALLALALVFGMVPENAIVAVPLLRNVYQLQNPFGVVAVVLLSLLGGIGFHVARQTLAERRGWLPAALAVAVLVPLAICFFQGSRQPWRIGEHAFFFANVGLLGVGLVALIAAARAWLIDCRAGSPDPAAFASRRTNGGIGRSRPTSVLMLAVAGAALLYRHGLHVDVGFGGAQLTFPMVRARLDLSSPAIEAAKADANGEPFRLIGTDATLIPGFNTVYRVEGINGPDALMNPYYREFGRAAGVLPRSDWLSLVMTADTPRRHAALDFLGVRYLISAAPLPDASGYAPIAARDFTVYRSASAWPRAFFAPAVQSYTSVTELLDRIARARQPFAAVQANDPAATAATHDLRPSTFGSEGLAGRAGFSPTSRSAHDYQLGTNDTSFRIHAPSAGVIVLQETWLPRDFRATLNGRDVPYFRVNHAFKAIRVPAAGDYTVKFEYWPHGLAAAWWSSAAGLVALGGVIAAAGRSVNARVV